MDIILLDDQKHLSRMAEIWNQNKEVLKPVTGQKEVTTSGLEKWKDNNPISFYGVIVDEDVDDEMGGFFVLRESEDVLFLDQMAIADTYKRKSIGNAILRYCKYQAKEIYEADLKLHVLVQNVGGINFFFSSGFKIEKYNQDQNEYCMILK